MTIRPVGKGIVLSSYWSNEYRGIYMKDRIAGKIVPSLTLIVFSLYFFSIHIPLSRILEADTISATATLQTISTPVDSDYFPIILRIYITPTITDTPKPSPTATIETTPTPGPSPTATVIPTSTPKPSPSA